MRFHVLQHVSFETAGALGDEIRQRGHSLHTTAVYDQSPLPSLAEFDGLIVMGGPMSIYDEVEFPWLVAEKKLIGAAIRGKEEGFGHLPRCTADCGRLRGAGLQECTKRNWLVAGEVGQRNGRSCFSLAWGDIRPAGGGPVAGFERGLP